MLDWRKKIVTMVVEIRTTADNEDLAKAVTDHVKGDAFREAISASLSAAIGDEFEIAEGGSVEVEEENSD